MNKGIKEGHTIHQNTGLQGGVITRPQKQPTTQTKTKKPNFTNPGDRSSSSSTQTKKGTGEERKSNHHNETSLERYHNNSELRIPPPFPPGLHPPTIGVQADPSPTTQDLDTPDPSWTPHTWTPRHHKWLQENLRLYYTNTNPAHTTQPTATQPLHQHPPVHNHPQATPLQHKRRQPTIHLRDPLDGGPDPQQKNHPRPMEDF